MTSKSQPDHRQTVYYPEVSEVSRRGDQWVYWAPQQRVAVKLGPVAAGIMEVCRDTTSRAEIISLALSRFKLPSDSVPTVERLLDNLTAIGFLNENRFEPEARQAAPAASFKPLILYLHLTVKCNLSCSYCYNVEHRMLEKRARPLSRVELLDLIQLAARRGVRTVNFTGGEPLLSRDWEILARRCKELNIATTLLTNGALITERNAKTIAELFTVTILSLDSPDHHIHDAQRGRGSHAKALRGIHALRDAGYRQLVLRPVLTRHNLDTLAEFPDFAARECGNIAFIPVTYVPNSVEEEQALQLSPALSELQRATTAFRAALQRVGGKITDTMDIADDDMLASNRCGAGAGIISVDFNGDLYPCQAIHDPRTKMGNLRDGDYFEIAGGAAPGAAFRSIDHSDIEVCKSCSFNEICGGGCRATAIKLYGSITSHNRALCDINKANAWNQIWARLEQARPGSAVDPADETSGSCSSDVCTSGCV